MPRSTLDQSVRLRDAVATLLVCSSFLYLCNSSDSCLSARAATPTSQTGSASTAPRNSAGATPLHQAALGGNASEVDALLAKGADVNAKDNDGATPLHYAVNIPFIEHPTASLPRVTNESQIAVAKLLLKHGADINAEDNGGKTPLVDATDDHRLSVMQFLLDNGAQINRGRPWNPLQTAAAEEHADVVKFLLAHGADPNPKPGVDAPLLLAADSASADALEIVRCLLDASANSEQHNGNGETPLAVAALAQHWPVVKLLVEKGANINVTDSMGSTPLHRAALYHQADVVKLLVEHKARIDAKDKLGRTPMDYALKSDENPSDKPQTITALKAANAVDR